MGPFIEQMRIEELARNLPSFARVKILDTVVAKGREFPIYAFEMGPEDKTTPVFGLFGGVHGLERVGTHVVLAYLESMLTQSAWDMDLRRRFENCRLVSIPLINPAGMYFGTRSNPNGIDLMRNAPIEALGETPFMLGGHRMSRKLPWFRGEEGREMEQEARVLVDFVKDQTFNASVALNLDIHSGFGAKDRLWYPYAKTIAEFPKIEQVNQLKQLLDQSHPNHIYSVESQSLSYTTHGDLWDYLFDLHTETNKGNKNLFLPWTLEIGSWLWIRKNPIQLFSALGPFNPVKIHRHRRTMRRHMPLLDFFLRAAKHNGSWLKQ
ncbi:MAG: M14 family zinc carboxypeptidase [Bdellovibrionota bacterium]